MRKQINFNFNNLKIRKMDILNLIGVPYYKKGSGIHIKKKNRGKFTEYCGGEVTNECIQRAKKSKNPTLRKRATFAENARKWKHADGGILKYQEGTPKGGIKTSNKKVNDRLNEEDDKRLWSAIYGRFENEDAFDYDIDFENLEEKKDTSDVSEFFNSYLKSKGIQRILNNQKTWWEKRHPYRKYISNFDQGTSKWIKDAQTLEPYVYTTNMPTVYSYAYSSPYENQKTIVLGRKPTNVDGEQYDFDFTLGHEYAHGKRQFSFGFFGTYEDEPIDPDSAQAEALDQNTNTKQGHDSETDEKHADQWGLKYLLYKEGIHDAREDNDITLDQVKELRKRYPNLRPFKQMSDEQLMFQINHVAQNKVEDSNTNKSYFAKNGIKLTPKKYQSGGVTAPWRTTSNNRSTEISRWLDSKVTPIVKKVAHTINEYGNKESEKIVSSGARRAIFDQAMQAWNNKDRRGKTHSEHMKNYTQEAIQKKKDNMPSSTNSQVAAASSLVGSGVSFLGPVGKIAGTIMGIPDLVYDWAAYVDQPNNAKNTLHLASNYGENLAKITPGKLDDYVAKAGKFIGNVDDAVSASGNDLFNFVK